MSQTHVLPGTGVAAKVSLRKGGGLDIKILPYHRRGHPLSCRTLSETGNTGLGGYALTTLTENCPRGALITELLS